MNKTTVQVISFVSGLTIAAVVLGVTISKNQNIRNEIESQISSVLKTTRSLVDSYKSLASKSKTAASLIKSDAGEKSARDEAAEEEAQAQIDIQWDNLEAQGHQG
ncbi:MAG: hypothetical protein FWE41_00295 [Coriobacteriia bacterium]|nr:hypothetical protein [Coriobacteriia bacterium]MCL2749696.1 hypothetical protein [Coriobacteriia bacterium]